MTILRNWWRIGDPRTWLNAEKKQVKLPIEGVEPPFDDIITFNREGWPPIRLIYTHWGLKLLIRRSDITENKNLASAIQHWPFSLDKEIIWCGDDWAPLETI